MKKILVLTLAAVFGAVQSAFAAGASESSAYSLSAGKSQAVTLVRDSDTGDGIYYLKMTAKKGKSYTCWFEGGDAELIGETGIEIYAEEEEWDSGDDWGDDDDWDFDDDFDDWGSGDDDWDLGDDDWVFPPSAEFGYCVEQDGKFASWMHGEDWESDDPSSWTYYICLTGPYGAKTTVHLEEGTKNFLPAETLPLVPSGEATEKAVQAGGVSDVVTFDEENPDRVFKIIARNGVTYKLATKLVNGTTKLPLTADVFLLAGDRETAVEQSGTDIAPGNEVSFTADADQTYYIRLSTSLGEELNYPAFTVHTLAYSETGDLGLLKVEILGPESARWTIDDEDTEYLSGDSIVLSGTHTVKFSKSTELVTPANQMVTVKAGKDATLASGMYTDKYDHKDDVPSGATSWTLKNTATGYERTLWKDDPADFFTFDGKDGYYYDFSLSDVTGDARISITNATAYGDNAGIFALEETSVSKLALPKLATKYHLVVHHALPAEPANGTYAIEGSYANIGAIKFKSTAVKVKEDAASVTLTLSRTAADGRVRVKYATVAGTALPGTDYIAQNGIIEWDDGDKADKTIVVKLIPDLVAAYEGADKTFSVKIEPIPEEDREEDEYEAVFTVGKDKQTLNVATVTLQETSKANAGTVSVDCSTPKKPVFDVSAGTDLDLTFLRSDGMNGDISVKVDASSIGCGTKTINWLDGDAEAKTITLAIPKSSASDLTATIKGTVKLSSASTAKPKFTASSITVNVANDQFEDTLTNWAKTLSKTDGVQVKESKSGTWFYMGTNEKGRPVLKHIGAASKLTFTLTGPCVFNYTEDGAEETEEVESIGKTENVVIESEANDEKVVTYEYLYNDGKFETILQTVKYGYASPIAGSSAQSLKVSSGKLPDGVKLEQDKTTKDWYVRGTPTKSGYYYAEIVDKNKNPICNPAFYVKAADLAIGTFNGILTEDGSALTNGFPSVGSVQVTVTSAGKLTAKVTVAGTSYSFSDTGFDAVDDAKGDVRSLTSTLMLTKKIASVTYTNELQLTVVDGASSDAGLLGSALGAVELTMAIPDTNNRGAQADIRYTTDLYRDNTKIAAALVPFATFGGYYTAALPILAPEAGKPQGSGYLTFTVGTDGKCKTAGKLTDDTAISSALVPAVIGDFSDLSSCELVIPVFQAKKPAAFGGYVRIRLDGEGVPVVDSTGILLWASDNASGTYDGVEGWKYELTPVGGWYDKVVNLQAYYINYALKVDMADIGEFPSEMLPDGYIPETEILPSGVPVEFAGNAFSVPKKSMVKSTVNTKIYDLAESTNPCDVKISLTRATGIVTGSFSLWGWDEVGAEQKEIKGFKHTGILLLSRDTAGSTLADNVLTAGYCANSVKVGSRTWKYSLPFNILAEDQGEIDWWAADEGWNPDWGEEPED